MLPSLGKTFLIIGGLLVVIGLVLIYAPSLPWLGRMPGDIHYQGKNIQVFFPITTCIILSILITILLSFFRH